jgi:hypothetical protein
MKRGKISCLMAAAAFNPCLPVINLSLPEGIPGRAGQPRENDEEADYV